MSNIEILMFGRPEGCPGCNVMKPIAKEIPNLKILDVEDEANFELVRRYGIRSGLPVFIKTVAGVFAERKDGVSSKAAFTKWCTTP